MSRLVGTKIGTLTILDAWTDESAGGHPKQMVRVRCDCGDTYDRRRQGLDKVQHPTCRKCYLAKPLGHLKLGAHAKPITEWMDILGVDPREVTRRTRAGSSTRQALLEAVAESPADEDDHTTC